MDKVNSSIIKTKRAARSRAARCLVAVELALPKRWHRDWDVVGVGADAYAALAGVRRDGADTPRRGTFGGPEHVTQHSTRRSSAVWCDVLNEVPGRVDQRRAEARAFRRCPRAGDDVQ